MPPTSLKHSAILLITALILMQGAAALTIEQAPLNPAFVAYTEGLDAGDKLFSIECYGDSCPATGTDTMPYTTGYLPAPAVTVWPDTYAADAYGTAGTTGTAFPSLFDLRDKGRVTPVRDQGDCGSCWAFATYGSLESTYLTDTGKAENFSENNMKNLCSNLCPDSFDFGPCSGGNTYMSAAYLTRGNGPIREADDEYLLPMPSTISPTNLSPVLDVRDITFLPERTAPHDNDLLKQTLMDNGALVIMFSMNSSCFADNRTTYYAPDGYYSRTSNHVVTLVGWDDAFPKGRFGITPPGDGAFILKNSWGTGSGEDGFFYISYYDTSFAIAPPTLFTGVPADAERQIYQYDPLGWNSNLGTGTSTTYYGANIFTAENYEELTDVSFYTSEPGTEYTVAIFTNFTTPPGDVAPVAWTSGTSALPGYHTISLPETVTLMPGEVFSVVLEITSPTSVYPLPIEKPIPGYSSKATAGLGESYVSEDGETWEDLTIKYPNTNVCIKAFTHPLTVVPRDYATIQAAVDAAASGDTIVVEAGTYPEALMLNKTVTLTGVGMPVIATPEDWIGMEIDADNCTISGFSFEGKVGENLAVGISGDDCTLFNTEITGCKFGLYIRDVQGLSLSTIAMHDNAYNLIYWDYCENPGNTIDETVTVNGRPVIYREGVSGETIDASSNAGAVICVNATDITIRDTTTEAIGDGITLLFCRDVCVENVTADRIFSDGVWASSSENITVHDSSFGPQMYRGISAEETNGLQAAGNNFAYWYGGAGVSLSEGRDSLITNNTMSGDEDSVGVRGNETSGVIVAGNTIEGTGYGIDIINADTITVSDNTMDVTKYGIRIQNGETITVSGNTVECKDRGIGMLIAAEGADITGNTIENCSEQAWMNLNNSVVRENHFSGAAYPAVLAWDAEGDVYVYRNDFVLTEIQTGADTLSADLTGTESFRQEIRLVTDTTPDIGMRSDRLLNDGYTDDASAAMATMSTQDVVSPDAARNTPVWHSPTGETYWYYGRAFTQTMGNYWSTYNGTDTTHDGIGETPFTIRDNETDIYPLVNPVARYFNENPLPATDEDASAAMATSGALSAGESTTLRFTGSAVQTVTITAKEESGRILLTVDEAGTGPDGLEGPVYQYLSAQLNGMTDENIKEATFSFRVATTWLNTEKLLPKDMALWRFHDNAWQELPTTLVREENGWIYYEGTTPGFSTFAIAAGDKQQEPATTDAVVPDVNTGTDTVDSSVTTEPVNETASEPQVTVAIPGEEGTGTPTGTTPQQSPLGLISVIGGAAAVALLFGKRQ